MDAGGYESELVAINQLLAESVDKILGSTRADRLAGARSKPSMVYLASPGNKPPKPVPMVDFEAGRPLGDVPRSSDEGQRHPNGGNTDFYGGDQSVPCCVDHRDGR